MKAARMAALGLLGSCVLAVFADAAWAQEAEQVDEKSFIQVVLEGGGWIGWVIITCSVISLALIIEHVVNIKRDKIVPPGLIDDLDGMLENEEYQEALDLCHSEENYLTNVLAAGLPKINNGFETMKQAMDERAEEEAIRLQQKIGWLSLIGNISPMLGLFGTVSGMIGAFQTIARLGPAVTPSDLADGISQALVTTFLGLFVAIPTMIAYFVFRNKVIKVSTEINTIADELVERFRK